MISKTKKFEKSDTVLYFHISMWNLLEENWILIFALVCNQSNVLFWLNYKKKIRYLIDL